MDVAMELAPSFAPRFQPKKKASKRLIRMNGEEIRTSRGARNLPFFED